MHFARPDNLTLHGLTHWNQVDMDVKSDSHNDFFIMN